ncbi:universal stress protein family protein [Kordia sp. SMS9]|uniref:universal stress protein n=1 Tax=Kordia sp. SMS9 TaxID=2282170 RepID=UPI000E0D32BE|nr:universal stress protein [Kordia sp. SMS9]AXG68119.1 universal stress protein family protein [Kordia sp. SMS9]
MNTSKYKLLVLTDLSKASNIALENAVNLSKIIGGSIDVFHVLKPSNVAEYENQHATIRSIDEARIRSKSKLKSIAKSIAKKYNVSIRTRCVLGNLKDETQTHITQTQPDIIVLGKRKPKFVDFFGDSFTKFIINSFEGSVLISGKDKALSSAEISSLGMLNTTADELPLEMANDLRKHLKNPIKRFYVYTDGVAAKSSEKTAENVVTFEFQNGSNTMNHIAKYVAKNNIELLCINPHNTNKNSRRLRSLTSNIKEAIHKINVPILIVNHKSTIQLQ